MSRGSPIIPVRIPRDVLVAIDAAIAATADQRFEGPHTRSSWIVEALRMRLNHLERARKAGRKRRRGTHGRETEGTPAGGPAGPAVPGN